VREWYGYHFPELVAIVNDNYLYCRMAQLIKDKSSLNDESLPAMTEILNDETKAAQVLEAARHSMGQEISPIDLINIEQFATRVASLAQFRKRLFEYLSSKMNACAPNLSALVGEQVGARLISHAGSLTSLAKYPASTVQILGAEKALFRALKTKGNTPKYGLIFHSPFIGRAGPKNKGRISRYLANKCSIASRIDSFSEVPTNKFGLMLKSQVEERLEFYKSGATPQKNLDVMAKVIAGLGDAASEGEALTPAATPAVAGDKKKKKKDKSGEGKEEKVEAKEVAVEEATSAKKEKKSKKDKRKADEVEAAPMETAEDGSAAKKAKKDKKSKKE